MVERTEVWALEDGGQITCTRSALRERELTPCSQCHYAVRDLAQHAAEHHASKRQTGAYR